VIPDCGVFLTLPENLLLLRNLDKHLQKVSMKDFAMEPPSFMMGAIKTGNEVTLKFDFKLTSFN
jgi:hypothetical protein